MGTVSNRHAYLRNATGRDVAIHPNAQPSPDIVEAGAVVRVAGDAAASLRESGFETAKAADWTDPIEAQREELERIALEREPAPDTDTPATTGEGDTDTEGAAS